MSKDTTHETLIKALQRCGDQDNLILLSTLKFGALDLRLREWKQPPQLMII